MRITESQGGRIVVEHEDGYVFTFQIHDINGLVMDMEDVSWPSIGEPPDAEELEQAARSLAEQEAKAQGWI